MLHVFFILNTIRQYLNLKARATRKPSLEIAPITFVTRSSCCSELCPITLTFELGLDNIQMNQHAKYLGQRSFNLKIMV